MWIESELRKAQRGGIRIIQESVSAVGEKNETNVRISLGELKFVKAPRATRYK